jgi:3-isopropylmalate/(R)-2-methylmalate dehydratase large subunit
MGKTLAEKILSKKSGNDARAGDIVIAKVDLVFVQDTTGPLAVRQFQASGFKRLANPQKTVIFIDHAVPSPNQALSNDHLFLRHFARETSAMISVRASATSWSASLSLCRAMSWLVQIHIR